jgi:hypothetical protein
MTYNVEEVDSGGRKVLNSFNNLADALIFANQMKRVSRKKIQVTSGKQFERYEHDKNAKVVFG